MEHLPIIEDPAYTLPSIPYLGHIIAYDCRGFQGFPGRQGWIIQITRDVEQEGPKNVDPALQTPENIAAFVQAWLYFGVLDEIFNVILGLSVSLEDFKDTRDGQVFLTTSQLRRHIRAWEDKQSTIDAEHYSGRELMEKSYFERLHSRLDIVLSELSRFFSRFRPEDDLAWARCLTTDLQMVIFILAETLKAAGSYIWREWQPGTGQGPLTVVGFQEPREIWQDKFGNYSAKTNVRILPLERLSLWPFRDLLGHKFAELGWCPNEYGMLRRVLFEDVTGLFIASCLRRPFSCTELSHGSCTADRCLASQVEAGTYQSKHASECADPVVCRNIEIDGDTVAQLIKQDRLPLVSLDWAPIQQWENEYRSNWDDKQIHHYAPVDVKWQETENYIAISHVWSHGLGNPKHNALPECQLRRLKRVAELVQLREELTEEPAIWIDTLCIPVNQKHRDVRKKAIGTISKVFRKARQVVVLDADLQQIPTPINRTELCTRILLCGWMRRLWTLNEAVISGDSPNCQRLLIMFANGPERYNSVFGQDLGNVYHSEAAVKALIRRLPQSLERLTIFTDLLLALEYRSTSWPEDEPICFAGLLGLDVERVLERNTAPERMYVLYSMLEMVPLEFVFHDSETLNIPGKRWPPRSLLSYSRSGASSRNYISKRTAATHARGVMLDKISAYFIKDIQPLTTTNPGQYYGRDPRQPVHTLFLGLHPYYATDSDYKELEVKILKISRPAILQNPFRHVDVILVSITGEEAGVSYCEYVKKLEFSRETHTSFETVAQLRGKKRQITFLQASNDVKWCLS